MMHTLFEGLRLAVVNTLYIALSGLLVVGTFYLGSLYTTGFAFSFLFLLTLALFGAAGIAYLYYWQTYTSRFPRPKAFLISLIGVLPNLYLWLGFSTWAKLLPGAEDDSCGGILFFAGAYLICMLTSFAMPLFSLFTGRKAPTT